MRILVLGGTSFLSRTVALEAVHRGHDVACAARGRSGTVPDGARLIAIDRDEPGGLRALAGERFDAVVDVAKMALPWVHEALEALADHTGHWTFVSSINAYADTATPNQTPDSPLLEPITDREALGSPRMEEVDPDVYGGIKVASENAVREAMGGRAFVPRPGLVTGPGDCTDRFGYWPARFSRGGRVVVPDIPDQPFQHVDVRDLASWIVDAGEQHIAGTYDAVGPVRDLGGVLREIAELTGAEDTELVPLAPEQLTAAGINPWGGPTSLPLWAPETHHGLVSHDPTGARKAGLAHRPLAETAHAALADERALGLDRSRKAGLSPEEEAALLT